MAMPMEAAGPGRSDSPAADQVLDGGFVKRRKPVRYRAFVIDIHEVSGGVVEELGIEHSDCEDLAEEGQCIERRLRHR